MGSKRTEKTHKIFDSSDIVILIREPKSSVALRGNIAGEADKRKTLV
jgi:hypothetical protein